MTVDVDRLAQRLRPAGVVLARFDADDERLHSAGSAEVGGRFEIGSVTKLFTCRLLEILAAEAVVGLDEPAVELLGPRWSLGRHVTLRRLAEHEAGLPRLPRRAWRAMLRNPEDPYSDLTVEDLRRSLPPWLPRSRSFRYSNFGAALLGHALAARTGKPWPDLVRERISRPLGLNDTDVDGPVAQPHSEGGKPVPPWTMAVIEGAGALRSTAGDLIRFVRAGAPALGWLREDAIRWHNGGTGGSAAFVGWHDATGRGVVLLANAAVADELTQLGLGLLEDDRRPSPDWSPLAG